MYITTLQTETSLGACRKCLCWLSGLSGSPATNSTPTDQPQRNPAGQCTLPLVRYVQQSSTSRLKMMPWHNIRHWLAEVEQVLQRLTMYTAEHHDAMASTGPYANHLHLAPDRQPCQHLITPFFTDQMLFLIPVCLYNGCKLSVCSCTCCCCCFYYYSYNNYMYYCCCYTGGRAAVASLISEIMMCRYTLRGVPLYRVCRLK